MNSGWVQKGVIVKWQHTFDIDRYVHCLDSADSSTGVYVRVCEGGPTCPSNSLKPAGCPKTRLNSDTTYPEIASDSTAVL